MFGADSSRWKPSTPVNVRGVLTGTPSTTKPSPAGEVARASCDFRGKMFTILLVDRPLLSVAVTLISKEVSADASPVLGMVNDPRSSGERADEWVEVGAVMQPDLGLDVPVVQVEAGRVTSERVVRDRVARPVQLAFGRC